AAAWGHRVKNATRVCARPLILDDLDLRPILIIDDDLDVLQRAPVQTGRVPDAQIVGAVERAPAELHVLNAWLGDEALVRRADRHRDVPLGRERLATGDLRDAEVEEAGVAVEPDDARAPRVA